MPGFLIPLWLCAELFQHVGGRFKVLINLECLTKIGHELD
jgi:hypothetical protein